MGRLDDIIRRSRAREAEPRRHAFGHMAILGSEVRGDARPGRAVDTAGDSAPSVSLSLTRMEEARLSPGDIVGQPVDVGDATPVRPTVRAAIARERVVVQ